MPATVHVRPNKLMKGFIGSAKIDTNSRLCMASSVAGHIRAFGEDLVPGCYDDIDNAEFAVFVGSNAAWCHPLLHRRLADARARRGTRVVVIDPRRTASCDIADLHLAIRPGSDVAVFAALLVHLADNGACDIGWRQQNAATSGNRRKQIHFGNRGAEIFISCQMRRKNGVGRATVGPTSIWQSMVVRALRRTASSTMTVVETIGCGASAGAVAGAIPIRSGSTRLDRLFATYMISSSIFWLLGAPPRNWLRLWFVGRAAASTLRLSSGRSRHRLAIASLTDMAFWEAIACRLMRQSWSIPWAS